MVGAGKRGQAAGAAILLIVIVGVLIGFIVLVSPQERAEILGENFSSSSDSDEIDEAFTEENLLIVNPGRIDYLSQREIEHPLPVANIYTRTEAEVLDERNVIYAKKGVFSEEQGVFSFSIPNIENTEDVILNFKILDTQGRLIITLNEVDVFDAEVEVGNIQPISLPENLLKEENVLVFSVASPGVAFWATNDISLEEVKIVGEVTSLEAQSSKNIFLVSETEWDNLVKVVLKFQPDCIYNEVGKLSINVNGNEVYNGVPDCDLAMVPIEFSPSLVYQGENSIVFYTEKGNYLLSHVQIVSELKEVDFPTYYFELSNEQFEDVYDEDLRLRLKINFVDVVNRKSGEIVFNGHQEHFDTKELTYTFDLSEDIVRGNNALKIKPRKTLEVRELRVDLVD
tara:strand:+ start:1466 stop:2659 length:1194 start_codon:yes stop_codon:yes gene_type:complete